MRQSNAGLEKQEQRGEVRNGYEKRGYLLSDFRLFHLNDAQGTNVDFHYHGFCKLLFLCSGTGGYNVEGQHYTLQAGDVVLVGSRQVHRPEFERGMPYERIILYLSPEFLQKNSVESCGLEEIFTGAFGHVLRAGEKERQRLFLLVEKLEKELSEEVYGTEVACKGLLLRLLVEIGRSQRSNKSPLQPKAAPKNDRIRNMMQYLDTHSNEEISMDSLAELFFVSKYHMMRQFQQETGFSIYHYLTERRLLHARDLLQQGYSATESCFCSGFRSYSSFTRAYAKRFGTTPTGRVGHSMRWEETYE